LKKKRRQKMRRESYYGKVTSFSLQEVGNWLQNAIVAPQGKLKCKPELPKQHVEEFGSIEERSQQVQKFRALLLQCEDQEKEKVGHTRP